MLGIISTNPEINRTLRGPGILPNDLDLSRHRSYLPLHHGWIVGRSRTHWNGYLGQGDEQLPPPPDDYKKAQARQEQYVKKLVRAEKIKAWAAVVGTVSSIAIAVMLGVQISKGS